MAGSRKMKLVTIVAPTVSLVRDPPVTFLLAVKPYPIIVDQFHGIEFQESGQRRRLGIQEDYTGGATQNYGAAAPRGLSAAARLSLSWSQTKRERAMASTKVMTALESVVSAKLIRAA